MGLINEKEEPEIILKLLIQNQNKIPQNYNQNSHKLIHKILNYYQFFESLLHKGEKNDKNNNIQNNTITNNISFKYKIDINKESNKINQQIDRIKKWINMLRTKNTLRRLSNERYSDSMEKNSLNYKKYLSDDIEKKTFFHSQSINPSLSPNFSLFNKLNHKSFSKQLNKEEMNLKINIFEYTDLNIEKGIKNFYIMHSEKFIQRIIKGPPDCFRIISWMILNKIPLSKNEKIYQFYLQKELNENIKKSIIKDIQRSFFHIKKEENEVKNLRPKERKLYNVLKAFSNLDIDLGYCQGMNIITSFLLNVFDFNEIEVFYLLISMFSSTYFERNIKKNNLSIRGFFSDGFPLLLFMNYIFDFEFKKLLPDLKKKLDDLSITYDMWIGKWFQTLFIIVLPFEMCKRLFDCIFVYGILFLIQFGLALIIHLEKNLIKLNDEIEISNYFKKICENIMKNNTSYFQEIMNINELINKSEKIKIDYNDYFNKYIEENPSFKDEIEKNNIEYELYDDNNNDFENTIDSNFKRKETLLYSDEENSDNYKINEFNLLDNNKSNQFFKIHKKKSKHNENYDEDIEENISIDFGQLSESKKYKYSIIMNSISVLNNQEFSYDDNNNKINVEKKRHKKLKAFYKFTTIDPNFIRHIDLKENKKIFKK